MHDQASSINFGKQLIDTFKPSTILVEDGPLNTLKKPKRTEGGLNFPPEFDSLNKLEGSQISDFVNLHILSNKDAY